MGTEKHLKKIEKLLDKSNVISFDSITKIVGDKNYAKQVTRNLILKGKMVKVGKGLYTNKNEISLAVYRFMPAYLGLQDALSFHNLWEQETIPIIITSSKARPGIRKIMGQNVLVKRVAPKYLFGFGYYDESGITLPYSDQEKTFIDLLYFREHFKPFPVDIEKMKKYLQRYPQKFRITVMKMIKE